MSLLFTLIVQSLLSTASPALAKPADEGVPVRVVVRDDTKTPIATAVVRHPQEADRHRVNAVDGSWEASVLYLPDGSELRFTAGMTLNLEISAPGYTTQVLTYQVRKRRNLVDVTLPKIDTDDSQIEEPTISFGRDEPRE
jgi:hypothetical protein